MQPLALQQLSESVLSQNSADRPFEFSVSGNQIIGTWKIADIKWNNVLSQGSINKEYKIVVDLDETTHTYTFREYHQESEGASSFNPLSGGLSFGKSGSLFKGKTIRKEFGAGVALSVTQNGQSSGHTYRYNFDTSAIKRPLFDALAQSGWLPAKRSFLTKLFSR